MKTEQLLSEIEKLAKELDIDLRYENGEFRGGLCVLNEQRLLIIHSKMKPEQKLRIIAREIATLDLSDHTLCPELRDLVDSVQKVKTDVENKQS